MTQALEQCDHTSQDPVSFSLQGHDHVGSSEADPSSHSQYRIIFKLSSGALGF